MSINPDDPAGVVDSIESSNNNSRADNDAVNTETNHDNPLSNRTTAEHIHQSQQQQQQQQREQEEQQQQDQQQEERQQHRPQHHQQQQEKHAQIDFSSSDDEDQLLPYTQLARNTTSNKPEDDEVLIENNSQSKQVHTGYQQQSAASSIVFDKDSDDSDEEKTKKRRRNIEGPTNIGNTTRSSTTTILPPALYPNQQSHRKQHQAEVQKPGAVRVTPPWQEDARINYDHHYSILAAMNNDSERSNDELRISNDNEEELNLDNEEKQQEHEQRQQHHEGNGSSISTAIPVIEARPVELNVRESYGSTITSTTHDDTTVSSSTIPVFHNNFVSIAEPMDRDWLLNRQQQRRQGQVDSLSGTSNAIATFDSTSHSNINDESMVPFDVERKKQDNQLQQQHNLVENDKVSSRRIIVFIGFIIIIVAIILTPTLLFLHRTRNSRSYTNTPVKNDNATKPSSGDNKITNIGTPPPTIDNSSAAANELMDLLYRKTITQHIITVEVITKQQSSNTPGSNKTTTTTTSLSSLSSSSSTSCQQQESVLSDYTSFETDEGRYYNNTLIVRLQCGNRLYQDGFEYILYEDSTTNNIICDRIQANLLVCTIQFQTNSSAGNDDTNRTIRINGTITTQSAFLFACGTSSIVYDESNTANVTSINNLNKHSFLTIETIPLTAYVQDSFCSRNDTAKQDNSDNSTNSTSTNTTQSSLSSIIENEAPLVVRISMNRICYRQQPEQPQQSGATTVTDPNALFEIRSVLDSSNDNGVCLSSSDLSKRIVQDNYWTYCESNIDNTSNSASTGGSILPVISSSTTTTPTNNTITISGLKLFDYLSDENYATRCYNVGLTNQSRYFGYFLQLPSMQNQISGILR